MTNDAGFALAYAIIMLNTDQHNHNVRKQNIPMTVEVSDPPSASSRSGGVLLGGSRVLAKDPQHHFLSSLEHIQIPAVTAALEHPPPNRCPAQARGAIKRGAVQMSTAGGSERPSSSGQVPGGRAGQPPPPLASQILLIWELELLFMAASAPKDVGNVGTVED